jgi:hypothetical protein
VIGLRQREGRAQLKLRAFCRCAMAIAVKNASSAGTVFKALLDQLA